MAAAYEEESILMNIPRERDIRRLNEKREQLERVIGDFQDKLQKIEADRERRPEVYRRGSSGGKHREQLVEEMQVAMDQIKYMVEDFKRKFRVYLEIRDALPAVCSVGAVAACIYTGNVLSALKIIGGVFTLVTGSVLYTLTDTNIPLNAEDRLWIVDFFKFFVNSVRPKLD